MGPPVILVTGGLDAGAENAPLARALAGAFTAYNYNRRGRGESGDTQLYAVEREIEDIDALIAEAGGSAHVYGVSSGGALALEAAAAGLAIDRVAVYEVPYMTDRAATQAWRTYVEQLGAVARRGASGGRDRALHAHGGRVGGERRGGQRLVVVAGPGGDRAHACLRRGVPGRRASHLPPASRRSHARPWLPPAGATDLFEHAADAIAASLPHAERRTLEGQGHVVDPEALAPVLERFFRA